MKLTKLTMLFLCGFGSIAMMSKSEGQNMRQPGEPHYSSTSAKSPSQRGKRSTLVNKKNKGIINDPGIVVQFQFNGIQLLQFEATAVEHPHADHVFPKGTVLTIETSQNQAKKTVIRYQMDEAPEQPYFESLRLTAKGEHTIKVIKIDSLGTEHPLKPIRFKIVE